MPRDFIPRPDQIFASFAKNFCEKILADYEAYGVPQAMAEECAATQVVFEEAFRVACDPLTRTASAVARKNRARADCERVIRFAAGNVRGNPNATAAMRVLVQMNERNSGGRSAPLPVPDTAPLLMVTRVMGQTIVVRVTDIESNRARKPRGVHAAFILAAVGPNPSPDIRDWMMVGTTTRIEAEFTIPGPRIPPGTPVTVCAQWMNPRGQRGPESRSVSIHTDHQLGRPNIKLLAA
jgi:hypothetical protein